MILIDSNEEEKITSEVDEEEKIYEEVLEKFDIDPVRIVLCEKQFLLIKTIIMF